MALSTGLVRLCEEDRATLVSWTRSPALRAGLAQRARILLAVDAGEGTNAVCARLGVSRPTVSLWKKRYAAGGLAALEDAPRSGRPKLVDDAAILAATLDPPPERLAVTHWS